MSQSWISKNCLSSRFWIRVTGTGKRRTDKVLKFHYHLSFYSDDCLTYISTNTTKYHAYCLNIAFYSKSLFSKKKKNTGL